MQWFSAAVMGVLLLAMSGLIPASASANARDSSPHSEASLVAAATALVPGQPLWLALRLEQEAGWHSYWINPGDAGLPTRLSWQLPAGFEAGDIEWPAPVRMPQTPLMSYGYEGLLHLPVMLKVPESLTVGEEVTLKLRADWLICADICYPAHAELTLNLPVAAQTAKSEQAVAIQQALDAVPRPWPGAQLQVSDTDQQWQFTVQLPDKVSPKALAQSYLFLENENMVDHTTAQTFVAADNTVTVVVAKNPLLDIENQTDGEGRAADPVQLVWVTEASEGLDGQGLQAVRLSSAGLAAPVLSSADGSLLAVLGLALVGGMILNLMPCVFPVLGLKVLGFVEAGSQQPAQVRRHGYAFTLGVLLSFWCLAALLLLLREGGAALGWGFQLQNPWFVAAMALLMVVIASNLWGVFEFGVGMTQLGAADKGERYRDSIFSGVLVTAVATPCTAPFMGSALGYAIAQPSWIAMLVFTALALGVALPYLLLSMFPAATRQLPRPGPWMETLKQLLAFPMLATGVWLLWVLGQQAGLNAMAAVLLSAVGLAMALWWWGRLQRSMANRGWLLLVAALFCVALLPLSVLKKPIEYNQNIVKSDWVPWSEKAVEVDLQAGLPVFVDFTAAWCLTCQVNKKVALQDAEVEQAFVQAGVQRYQADWTRYDPAITEALAKIGRSGVPVYLFYPKGSRDARLLPEVLSPALVLAELSKP